MFPHALLTLALLLVATAAAHAGDIRISPDSLQLGDAFARRQLQVSIDGRDVTRAARYSTDSAGTVTVDATGFVTPVSNGSTTIRIEHGGAVAELPVTVSGMDVPRDVDFANEIEPLMSKFGCNSGGCHGKASGQNGFKLSLFGFDAAFDHQAIVVDARGRRISPSRPEQSLLLLKAVGTVPHGGGKRLEVGSEPYRLILAWIQSGAPAAVPSAPGVRRLLITPAERILVPGEQQQLAVLVEYTDGSRRDITRSAEYSSNLDVVATVDSTGLVSAGEQSGEAAVMVRYMGKVAVFNAVRPHAEPLDSIPGFTPANRIDELVLAKWKKLGLRPSPVSDDATFLRRATLDIAGRIPTVSEAEQFLADGSADKRERLVDRLLAGPDYPAYFAMKWGSILRNSNLASADKASFAFHNWIKDMIARNRPYDEFVRGIVAASGEWQDAPAVNWYWQSRDDQLHTVTADTAQLFLGLRLQCARCHHHPYERWSQADYFGVAGFFSRLGRKSFGEPPPYFSSPHVTTGEINPATGRGIEPKFLDGDVVQVPPEDDPRSVLVDWMARPGNPFFARAMVNRMWGHFFARGIVQEVDDLRETNPPSNPELLDHLASEFTASRFDVKRLIRYIATSRVYQLSSEPTSDNRYDLQNFARYYARRMPAEVVLDSIDQACGSRTQFGGISSNARAVDLPHERFYAPFLDTFDRPRRVSSCECERSTAATLSQVLLLANSDEVESKVADGTLLKSLFESKKTAPEKIEHIYLAALSRRPTLNEATVAANHVAAARNERQGIEDILWGLLNSREFLFNH